MKKIIFIVVALCAAVAVNAQDRIVKRNATAEQIEAKVVEVGSDNISYRKWTNQSGPIYTIKRSEVFFIQFENGEKEVITPYDAEPTSAQVPAATSVSTPDRGGFLATSRQTAVSRITERKPLHAKALQIDLTVSGGFTPMIFEDNESLSGLGVGAGVGFNFFYDRYSRGMIGASVGYTYITFSEEGMDNLDLTTLDMDIYYGMVGDKTSRFGAKTGLTLTVPLSCKQGDYDMGDALNGVSVGWFGQVGWSWTHSGLGLRLQYDFSNTFSETKSVLYGVKLYYSYRF